MYQILGIKTCLSVFATVAALIALALSLWSGMATESPSSIWRLASLSVTLTTALTVLLGQTVAFAYICKIPIISNFMPPIDGEWIATFRSNWPEIAKAYGYPSSDKPIQSRMKIKARLFKIDIETTSITPKPDYMRSDTVSVRICSDAETNKPTLYYIYSAFVADPEATDTDRHLGAARVNVLEEGGELTIKGSYWTDRNWPKGLNTAGSLSIERVS
jgi:SMODS-associating 2TM, beta-strand rich effector domain